MTTTTSTSTRATTKSATHRHTPINQLDTISILTLKEFFPPKSGPMIKKMPQPNCLYTTRYCCKYFPIHAIWNFLFFVFVKMKKKNMRVLQQSLKVERLNINRREHCKNEIRIKSNDLSFSILKWKKKHKRKMCSEKQTPYFDAHSSHFSPSYLFLSFWYIEESSTFSQLINLHYASYDEQKNSN